MRSITTILIITLVSFGLKSQFVPGEEENIPFLVTFGNQAEKSHGDDDFKQAFFFIVPKSYKKPFYLRVYDPGTGSPFDEKIGATFNSVTRFSFYGGNGVYSSVKGSKFAADTEKEIGDLLTEEEYGVEDYHQTWIALGPFNPSEGEYSSSLDGYIFKVIAEGIEGDDGNVYKYCLSSSGNANLPLPGANAFTFEYTVRLHESNKEVSHLYPYVDNKVNQLKQHNFDLDGSCSMRVFSVKKISEEARTSKDGIWTESSHQVYDSERESCMDFQIVNNYSAKAKNNNAVFYITNEYDELEAFFAVPLGDFTPKKKIIIE